MELYWWILFMQPVVNVQSRYIQPRASSGGIWRPVTPENMCEVRPVMAVPSGLDRFTARQLRQVSLKGFTRIFLRCRKLPPYLSISRTISGTFRPIFVSSLLRKDFRKGSAERIDGSLDRCSWMSESVSSEQRAEVNRSYNKFIVLSRYF